MVRFKASPTQIRWLLVRVRFKASPIQIRWLLVRVRFKASAIQIRWLLVRVRNNKNASDSTKRCPGTAPKRSPDAAPERSPETTPKRSLETDLGWFSQALVDSGRLLVDSRSFFMHLIREQPLKQPLKQLRKLLVDSW